MTAATAVLPPDTADARRYNRIRRWLGILEFIVGLALLIILLVSGWTGWLRDLAYKGSFQTYGLAVFIYTVLLIVISKIVSLPLDYYGFRLEHRYKLSNEKLGAWLWDEVKGLFVGTVLAALLSELVYFIIRQFPEHWWV